MKKRYYIGLSASFHDPSLAIVGPDGEVLFAEATERYLQNKRASNCPPDLLLRIPEQIKEYCESDAELIGAITWSEGHLRLLQVGVLNELSPFRKVGERAITMLDSLTDMWPYPRQKILRAWLRQGMSQVGNQLTGNPSIQNQVQIRRYDHHLTHAVYACYSSPFDEAVCAVVDGMGEGSAISFFTYRNGIVEQIRDVPLCMRLTSLGVFYGFVCNLCGFDWLKGEEWKVMGLAPYGRVDEELYNQLKAMVTMRRGRLSFGVFLTKRGKMAEELRRLKARAPGSPPLAAADIACTGQQVFADAMREVLNELYDRGISRNLVLTGGCALNSSWNGRILRETSFEKLHVPSAPADDGNSVGAALLAYYEDHPERRRPRKLLSPYLGTDIHPETREFLLRFNSSRVRHLPSTVSQEAAKLLAQGKIIGWMQGRAEFGPRALGHRSILADPRSPDMKDRINARVKFREEYRPFAPAILHEFGPEYFEDYQMTPYMERALVFREEVRHKVPAVVHEDNTGRLQSVTPELSERYYQLIRAFHELTGIPLILNTSFNIMGKPIIHTIQDALGMFYTCGLDALVIDDIIVEKEDNIEA